MLSNELADEARALRAQKEQLEEKLRIIEGQLQQEGLTRIEAIRSQISQLVDEAKVTSEAMGIGFYRETFLQGVDSDYARDQYWQSSDYC